MTSLLFCIFSIITVSNHLSAAPTPQPPTTWADIQGRFDQAMLEYYRALKTGTKSGKIKTPEDRTRLYNQIVGPAADEAQKYKMRQTEQAHRSKLVPGDGATPLPYPSPSESPAYEYIVRPEFELDGSNIPKEIVFEQRQKPKPSPSPSAFPKRSVKSIDHRLQ